MTAHLEHHHRRVPRHLLVRFLVLVILVGGGFAVLRWSPLAKHLTWTEISALLDHLRGIWWAPAVLVAGYALLCPFGVPASPLMIAGALVFGMLYGSLYNLVGVVLGGATTYFLGRHLGRDFLVHLAGRRLRKVERFVTRQGSFWGLVGIRFLPLPYVLVNYTAALAGIRPAVFLASTATGLAMTVPIFTYFSAAIAQAASGDRGGMYVQAGIGVALLMLITLAPRLWAARQRRQRYLQICAARRKRSATGTVWT